MIPQWLEKYLTDLGRWNSDGISRSIVTRRCHCGEIVMRGLDADICGLPTTADFIEVDQLGEIIVLAQGRWTFTLDHFYKSNRQAGWQLNSRYMRRWPVGRVVVVPSHLCGSVTPARRDPVMLNEHSTYRS
jgi:hypothetical protein